MVHRLISGISTQEVQKIFLLPSKFLQLWYSLHEIFALYAGILPKLFQTGAILRKAFWLKATNIKRALALMLVCAQVGNQLFQTQRLHLYSPSVGLTASKHWKIIAESRVCSVMNWPWHLPRLIAYRQDKSHAERAQNTPTFSYNVLFRVSERRKTIRLVKARFSIPPTRIRLCALGADEKLKYTKEDAGDNKRGSRLVHPRAHSLGPLCVSSLSAAASLTCEPARARVCMLACQPNCTPPLFITLQHPISFT